MAGVKGRSGGARPGAGRKPNPESQSSLKVEATPGATPLEVLKQMMNDPEVPVALRIKAAQAAAPYEHPKKGEGGKKDEAADRAKAAASKFRPSQAPTRLQ